MSDKVHVSEDGYLLSKVVPLNKVTRYIDWKALDITPEYINEQSKLKLGPLIDGKFTDQRKQPNYTDMHEFDRFIITEMCMPYNPEPDDKDVFVYYSDIGALSGSAGYIRLRDGYVWSERVIMRS